MATTATTSGRIETLLGVDAENLLAHVCEAIPAAHICPPGPDVVERVWEHSDRSVRVLRNLASLYEHGRLGGTGYLSILPVDQGVEHAAGASFAPNPEYFDPAHIIELAIDGGCSAVATTFGGLGIVARRFAHRLPLIVKINHNELLSYPNTYDQTLFATVAAAHELGAVAIGATIYFGSTESRRQIVEISEAFTQAHELGMATVLWCYLRNPAFVVEGRDYHGAADLTGQANYLGVTLEADIVKQKLPDVDGGFDVLKFGKTSPIGMKLRGQGHPIDLARYQVANCYMGRVALLNSGGPSGKNDEAEAVRSAVINKRAGGAGLIAGRKVFQRPRREGIALLNLIQDVYLNPQISIA